MSTGLCKRPRCPLVAKNMSSYVLRKPWEPHGAKPSDSDLAHIMGVRNLVQPACSADSESHSQTPMSQKINKLTRDREVRKPSERIIRIKLRALYALSYYL